MNPSSCKKIDSPKKKEQQPACESLRNFGFQLACGVVSGIISVTIASLLWGNFVSRCEDRLAKMPVAVVEKIAQHGYLCENDPNTIANILNNYERERKQKAMHDVANTQ